VFQVFRVPPMKLGKREIDLLACPPDRKDRLVFDDELSGFAVRVTRDGAKVFLFQYRRGAAVRRVTIGRYGELTPAQARKRAVALRGRVAAGGDPAAERAAELAAEAEAARKRRQAAQADALSLGKLIELWAAKQLAAKSESYRREAQRALRVHLAGLLGLPAHGIQVATVQRALDGMQRPRVGAGAQAGAGKSRRKGPPSATATTGETQARRVRAYGRALYNWAMKRNLVPGNPFAAATVEGRDLPRERVLTDAELGEVWRAAGGLGWPWAAYLRVLLLTLQREREVAEMAWSELSPDLALWELPGARTKNGKPHLVHLAEPVRAILRGVPRMAGSPLVFTTTGRTPISGFGHAKARLDAAILAARAEAAAQAGGEAAPLQPWRLHDLRRTGVTVLARLGVRWEVADRVLNHVQGAIKGVAAIYQRHDYLAEREVALTTWAGHVLTAAAVDGNAE
jgi:hypothetical protein